MKRLYNRENLILLIVATAQMLEETEAIKKGIDPEPTTKSVQEATNLGFVEDPALGWLSDFAIFVRKIITVEIPVSKYVVETLVDALELDVDLYKLQNSSAVYMYDLDDIKLEKLFDMASDSWHEADFTRFVKELIRDYKVYTLFRISLETRESH